MIKKLLPVIILVAGLGAGAGAGMFLRPAPPPPEEPAAAQPDGEATEAAATEPLPEAAKPKPPGEAPAKLDKDGNPFDYIKMSNQFVVPIVEDQRVASLVVMSLSLEVTAQDKDNIYLREPKLRDSFLRVLFDHANYGGFSGNFTSAANMDALRQSLREVAQRDIGKQINDVLVLEIARQDY